MLIARGSLARTLGALATSGTLALACGARDRNHATAGASETATLVEAPGSASGRTVRSTGQTVDVKMIGDGQGYRFEPAIVWISRGDRVRWTMISGGPHNVTFDSIPRGPQEVYTPNPIAPSAGPLLMNPGGTYIVSFAEVEPGVYKYGCTPHLAMGMKGQINVR
jgi:plastocyanin